MPKAVAEVGSTANNYQILARLASGGMAEIFLARGVSSAGVERYCVLKRIHRERAADVQLVRMFLDEAKLAAQLQHPNVAQVYDIGKLGDSYFFTMEYVHGETVRTVIKRARSHRRDLPLTAVLTIAAGAAAGLHHAHARIGIDGRRLEIVHRDVSPSNLMVGYEGTVKVVDFGVAKAADRSQETRSGTVKGKISYLSPEQARGAPVDRRSDLFALGIVMWEMLTGERLYKRASDFENMNAIVTEAPELPSSRRPSVPPELDAITMKLLAKDPDARFQTGAEVIEALEEFAARSGTLISASALARFLRELFGARPEPWIEMDTIEVPVTSEPVPSDLAIPIDSDVDHQLANVPKLDLAVKESPPARPPTEDHRTTPYPRVDDHPTTPHPKIDPAIALGAQADVPEPVGPPTDREPSPFAPIPTQVGVAVRSASGSHRGLTASGVQPSPATPLPIPIRQPRRHGWRLLAVVTIAAVAGTVAMWLAMRETATAPVPTAAATIDAAAMRAPAIAAVTIDAAASNVVDAPPPTRAPGADGEVVAVTMAATPDAAPVAAPKSEKPPRSEIDIAWEAGRYKDVLARCGKLPPAPDDVRCVIAACKLQNQPRALALFAKLDRTRRKPALAGCKSAGIVLEDKPKPGKCDADPMACQH